MSPRNRYVAGQLQKRGLATLLIDLLTADEEAVDETTGHLRFDIDLLADRLAGATVWRTREPEARDLRIGCFGGTLETVARLAGDWFLRHLAAPGRRRE